jgi:hypothetical protein
MNNKNYRGNMNPSTPSPPMNGSHSSSHSSNGMLYSQYPNPNQRYYPNNNNNYQNMQRGDLRDDDIGVVNFKRSNSSSIPNQNQKFNNNNKNNFNFNNQPNTQGSYHNNNNIGHFNNNIIDQQQANKKLRRDW